MIHQKQILLLQLITQQLLLQEETNYMSGQIQLQIIQQFQAVMLVLIGQVLLKQLLLLISLNHSHIQMLTTYMLKL